ncbi:hypothetical protein GCM10017744_046010 [Streptomyces antimycoticus]|uniref:Uncharacterized protein n=1 Tax=Streptomyces antimycoticus TaxID=68175 RepID=A0A4D4K757_9ACTN|nr:hypothetical protein SANT12839_056370 [Streptomyces antimycoticus]
MRAVRQRGQGVGEPGAQPVPKVLLIVREGEIHRRPTSLSDGASDKAGIRRLVRTPWTDKARALTLPLLSDGSSVMVQAGSARGPAPGLPGYRATGLPGYRATGLPGYRATGLPGYRATITRSPRTVPEEFHGRPG